MSKRKKRVYGFGFSVTKVVPLRMIYANGKRKMYQFLPKCSKGEAASYIITYAPDKNIRYFVEIPWIRKESLSHVEKQNKTKQNKTRYLV